MKKSTKLEWNDQHRASFQKVKDELRECTVMSFYDPHMHTTLVVDGSPFGLGAILTQYGKPIAYAGRSLTAVEKRYSQFEREALTIVFGGEHFHMYLIGCIFKIVTDHKPLLTIWNKINPPLRIERWGLRLLPYKYELMYQNGETNIADYLSRHHSPVRDENPIAEQYVNFIMNSSKPCAIDMSLMLSETAYDKVILNVIQLLKSGKLQHCKEKMLVHIRTFIVN